MPITVGVATSVVVAPVAAVLLEAAGFGADGVAAGSVAAAIQYAFQTADFREDYVDYRL